MAPKNVKTTPLDWEFSRGRITDVQKLAGDRFLSLYERAEIGGARAIDYSRQKVDTSFVYHGVPLSVMDAAQELKDIRFHLGRKSYELLVVVAGNRISIDTLVKEGACGDPWKDVVYAKHIRMCFLETLDELADFFGIVAKGKERATIRVERVEDAA